MSAIDANFFNTLPILASFLVAAIRLLPSMGRISNNLNNITFCLPALESVYNNVKGVKEKEKDNVSVYEADLGKNISFINELKLRNIHWSYERGSNEVLKGLELTILRGQSVGIIGQSGAGKSTLADIILALHVPQEGSITID